MPKATWLRSPQVRRSLESVARAMTGNYKLKLEFGSPACTDCETFIIVDPDMWMLEEHPEWVQYLLLKGQRDHEVAHQFSDKMMKEKAASRYPRDPLRGSIAADIANILEDARVELAQANVTPGCGPIFRFRHEFIFRHILPDNSTLADRPRVEQFTRGLVQKAVIGKYKGKIPDDTVRKLLQQCEPMIQQARTAPDSAAVLKLTYQIMHLIEPLIKELEVQGEPYSPQSLSHEQSGSANPQPMPKIEHDFQGSNKSPNPLEETNENDETDKDNKHEKSYPENTSTKKTSEKAQSSHGEESDSENEEDEKADAEAKKESREIKQATNGNQKNGDPFEKEKEDVNSQDWGEEFEALRKIAEEEMRRFENEWNKEKNKDPKTQDAEPTIKEKVEFIEITHDIHRGIKLRMRKPFPDEIRYEQAARAVKYLASRLEDDLGRLLRPQRSRMKPNLKKGKLYIPDMHKVAVDDPRIFHQKTKPIDRKDIAILLLIDTSASMSFYNRIHYATLAAVLMHQVFLNLKVPHAIVGYTAPFDDMEVWHQEYITFKNCFSPTAGKSLGGIDAYFNSRDGFTLRVAGNMLKRRKERKKLIVVISDGYPEHCVDAAYRDPGTAISDTHQAVIELERMGIPIIALSIGERHEHVPKIYRHYLLLQNVEKLPQKLGMLFKQVL